MQDYFYEKRNFPMFEVWGYKRFPPSLTQLFDFSSVFYFQFGGIVIDFGGEEMEGARNVFKISQTHVPM